MSYYSMTQWFPSWFLPLRIPPSKRPSEKSVGNVSGPNQGRRDPESLPHKNTWPIPLRSADSRDYLGPFSSSQLVSSSLEWDEDVHFPNYAWRNLLTRLPETRSQNTTFKFSRSLLWTTCPQVLRMAFYREPSFIATNRSGLLTLAAHIYAPHHLASTMRAIDLRPPLLLHPQKHPEQVRICRVPGILWVEPFRHLLSTFRTFPSQASKIRPPSTTIHFSPHSTTRKTFSINTNRWNWPRVEVTMSSTYFFLLYLTRQTRFEFWKFGLEFVFF